MIKEGHNSELEGVLSVANLMVTAARTAPKARGIDSLHSLIVTEKEKDALADYMEDYGKKFDLPFFVRDAKNINNSPVVVLLGIEVDPVNINGCNLCGYDGCKECRAHGGVCAFKPTDLGIAIGSAVRVASLHGCDNRVMYSVSKAALDLGYFPENVKIAFGIPLSVTGKNPFFDRK